MSLGSVNISGNSDVSASTKIAVDQEAFVTCVTNDTYALGALVLGQSLREVNTSRKLAIIITPHVSDKIRTLLESVYDVVKTVDILDSKDEANLTLLTRPELGVTFTKFHCWRLTQFQKCVFLDADTLVLKNCDELFEKEELSAVPDGGWPDCFNSGVFVFRPNEDTYQSIVDFAVQYGSFDGGDQGVLNEFFKDWRTCDISKHLSFIYNMNASAAYSYQPAYKRFGKDVKIVHFLGAVKPWMQFYNSITGKVQPDSPHCYEHLQLWWDTFMKFVQPYLTDESAKSKVGKCPYCRTTLNANILLFHQKECIFQPISCPDCSATMLRKDFDNHFCKSAEENTKVLEIDLLSEDLKELFTNENCSDTVLQVEDKEFKVHRAILSARSSVFASMFLHDTSEKQTGIVKIPDCEPDCFKAFLEYLYSGTLENISSDNAVHLYTISDKYNIREIKTCCTKYLTQNITVQNICEVVILADQYDEENLFSALQNFFNKNFNEIVLTKEWENLLKCNFRLANKLLIGKSKAEQI